MKYFLSEDCVLKRLEHPSVYSIGKDELYELDGEAFEFLLGCSAPGGCESGDAGFLIFCKEEGILKKERPRRRVPPFVEPGRQVFPTLRYLELQINRRCNLRCRHCYIGPSDGAELPAETVRTVLEELQRMQGLRVLITGGEPILHRDFEAINAFLPGYALRKVLFTNGTLLRKDRLPELNVDEIQVSLDGLQEGHDALRGKGTFKKAMRCIRDCLEAGLDVSVSTMVHARNLQDFDRMEETLARMGVKDWAVDVPCPEGYLADNPEFQLSPEAAGPYLRYGFGEGLHGGGQGYECGLHLMSVTAGGACAKCAFYESAPLGRIEEGLAACWQRLRHRSTDELDCDCDAIDACRGGCRYRAELLGSPLGRDLYRCAAYGKIK